VARGRAHGNHAPSPTTTRGRRAAHRRSPTARRGQARIVGSATRRDGRAPQALTHGRSPRHSVGRRVSASDARRSSLMRPWMGCRGTDGSSKQVSMYVARYVFGVPDVLKECFKCFMSMLQCCKSRSQCCGCCF
jgi:hypothetical protein